MTSKPTQLIMAMAIAVATAGLPASLAAQSPLSQEQQSAPQQMSVTGTLDVTNCWSGAFNLAPDFFALVTPMLIQGIVYFLIGIVVSLLTPEKSAEDKFAIVEERIHFGAH